MKTLGKIHLLGGEELRHIPGPSPHYVSIPQTLEIGKKIGLKVPSRIKIIAVEAKNMYNLWMKFVGIILACLFMRLCA